MKCSIRGAVVWLAPVMLAAWPGVGTAMEATCTGCLDNCCEWAFSADTALYGSYWKRMPVADYSWKHWEQYGFPPAPCREVLHDAAEYQRCVTKAFDRCYSERCKGCGVGLPFQDYFRTGYDERQRRGVSSRSKPVQLYPGQVIVVERNDRSGKPRSQNADGSPRRPPPRLGP